MLPNAAAVTIPNAIESGRPSSTAARRRSGDVITPEYLTACVRREVGPEAVVLNEGITNYPAICDHMARELAGTFARAGGSLGWTGGAAIGMKLAAPGKTFVASRRRLLHVFRPVRRALDGAALPHAVSANHL